MSEILGRCYACLTMAKILEKEEGCCAMCEAEHCSVSKKIGIKKDTFELIDAWNTFHCGGVKIKFKYYEIKYKIPITVELENGKQIGGEKDLVEVVLNWNPLNALIEFKLEHPYIITVTEISLIEEVS